MMRSLSVAATFSLLLSGCSAYAGAATRSWQTTDFSRLRVEGPFDVHVHVGQPSGVRASGPQDEIDRLSVDQRGDVLVIRPLPGGGNWTGWPHMNREKLTVDVNVRALSGVSLAGSGDVTVDRIKGDALDLALAGSGDLSVAGIAVTQLKLAVTGPGNLTVAGRARSATAMLTGSGDLHGDSLGVDEATVNLVGSGDVALAATRSASISLAGSGDVSITGPASCTVTRSGSGDIHCAHQMANADD